jgi:C_GCAxxG_C_C family probable redox protein
MIAVGDHFFGPVTEREIRMTTGFGGGVGLTYQEICGAFSAGVMIIGSLFGRSSQDHDDELCQAVILEFRDRFRNRLDTIYCSELREERYGSGGEEPCSVLVERASRILVDVIEDFKGE